MKSLIESVKMISKKVKSSSNIRNFLDNSFKDPSCQKLIKDMNELTMEEMGIEGHDD
jgi:hypothetical protein